MVFGSQPSFSAIDTLSVLALSSRFDGLGRNHRLLPNGLWLSVLALSSRFDGHRCMPHWPLCHRLSVLALSSRFDGHVRRRNGHSQYPDFQYSLCRVVLMVAILIQPGQKGSVFQYSLCRVVLMVRAQSIG